VSSCGQCGSTRHVSGSHDAMETMYRREEAIEIDGHKPDVVRVAKVAGAGIYDHVTLLEQEAAVIRRWYLPEGREVLGIFYEVADRENDRGVPSRQPGASQGRF